MSATPGPMISAMNRSPDMPLTWTKSRPLVFACSENQSVDDFVGVAAFSDAPQKVARSARITGIAPARPDRPDAPLGTQASCSIDAGNHVSKSRLFRV